MKHSYFPIEDARMSGQDDPEQLDPEELRVFQGIVPVPTVSDPDTYGNHRARVTIKFLDLQEREELRCERAEVI